MPSWQRTLIGYCIIINLFLALFGILINDLYAVMLALSCIVLVSFPIVVQDINEKEDEEENDSE